MITSNGCISFKAAYAVIDMLQLLHTTSMENITHCAPYAVSTWVNLLAL